MTRSENNSVGCSSPYPFTWSWGLDSVLSGSACVCSLTCPVSPSFRSALRTADTNSVAHWQHLPYTLFFAHRVWYEVLSIVVWDRKELLGLLENKFIEKRVPCTQLHTWASEPMPLASALWLLHSGWWQMVAYCLRLVSVSSSCQFFSISSLQLRKASSSRRMDSASVGLVRMTTIS